MAKKKEVIHLRNRALEFIKTLRGEFNDGVYFYELSVGGPTNPEDDDMGPVVAAARDRDYATLIIGVEPEDSFESKYSSFDSYSFEYDFRKYAKEFFGPLDYNGFEDTFGINSGREIEIYRECPEYKKWLKKIRGN